MNPNLELFKRREEVVSFGSKNLLVRELATAVDLADMRDKPDYNLRMIVLCVFEEDGVTPAFAIEDLPDMKTHTALFRLADLVKVVSRVNGADQDAVIKNSEAVPTDG